MHPSLIGSATAPQWCETCHVSGPHSPSVEAGVLLPCVAGPKPTTAEEILAAMRRRLERSHP